ncbi:hypothetical protein DVR12_03830 [Chitinophaga silvatica]|uniref:VWA containing CoxE family protein n=1 Tax=Chitinophaga silvatica TaxID=2282649 RepID=A0A3E1YHT5_9BACT|nr:hypothetical protein [Chitinophaga silvatica]RFS26926.1 hypothetical protein DVR12_03830 [Chitinophaga silvatica]
MFDDNIIEIPLQQSFFELMKLEANQSRRGIDLDSYLLLIDTWKRGYGLSTKEELIFLCKKIWLKPFHKGNHKINERVLEEILDRNLRNYIVAEVLKPEITSDIQTNNPIDDSLDNTTQKEDNLNDILKSKSKAEENKIQNKIEEQQQEGELSLYISSKQSEGNKQIGTKNFNNLFSDRQYTLNNKYLPVGSRFIEQSIRSLRYKVKGIGYPVIDIPSTVRAVANKGYFRDYKYHDQGGFVTRWTLLIDHQGSMVAFKDLIDAFVQCATAGGLKNEGEVLYFRNYPDDHLFTNPERTRSIKLNALASRNPGNILIISDAGAARGYYNEERIKNVNWLLYRLRRHKIAWLNPVPKKRWKGTSADEISNLVKMFEVGTETSDTLGSMVSFYKGKSLYQKETDGY